MSPGAPLDAPPVDAREARARTSPARFALLLLEALVFVALAHRFYPKLFPFSAVVVACFAAHYWAPFRFKEPCFIALSLVGGAVALGSTGGVVASEGGSVLGGFEVVAILLVLGVVIHRIVSSGLAYALRAASVAAIFAAVMVTAGFFRAQAHLPPRFYEAFGLVFMLNVFPYLYDARHAKKPASFREFARAFFALPSFRLVAPFLDVQRMGPTFYKRDIHKIAQEGINLLARGSVQLALYELGRHRFFYAFSAEDPRSPRLVLTHLMWVYTMYFKTSGMIHMYLGVLHLFGYDLPEAYRWYMLAHSPLDFWRRTNIYFKDTMTRVVYFPIYFALRKRSDAAAQVLGIAAVFAGTWFIHIWVLSFFTDLHVPFWRMAVARPQEAGLWAGFGLAATGNLVLDLIAERRRKGNPAATRRLPVGPLPKERWAARAYRHVVARAGFPPGVHPLRVALQIAAMQLSLALLFSLQQAPSVRVWLLTVKWWN